MYIIVVKNVITKVVITMHTNSLYNWDSFITTVMACFTEIKNVTMNIALIRMTITMWHESLANVNYTPVTIEK